MKASVTQSPLILAIESSCDDTAAAVIKEGKILANIVANQDVHKQYGGVIPELASRSHQKHIIPVVDAALSKAGVSRSELSAVAFTQGPGLVGSLLVGAGFAKGFAMAEDLPLIGVHHLQAHIAAHFIEDPKPAFPFLCLLVSGGHTQIVLVKDYLDMEIIGHTQDDAAGEAFDKAAKILGLEYPGGPLIDKFAAEGDPKRFKFPQPRVEGFNYSFSGLKTAILYFIQDEVKKNPGFIAANMADICASVQHTIVDYLLYQLQKAAEMYEIKEIAIAGGVSANSGLRKSLENLGRQKGWNIYIPRFEYCTDNAAMIAMAAHYLYLEGRFTGQDTVPFARGAF